MNRAYSLRARLTVIILIPLMMVSVLVGYWLLRNAQDTASDVFERGLLTAALAVANDVAVSDGDALSPETLELLESFSSGQVFYHVYAPDGVIVAGYATPPVGIPRMTTPMAQPLSFEAIYLGRPVSGVRLQTLTQIEGFSGIFTTTVWQESEIREQFVRDLILRVLIGLGAVIGSVALIVWFGVRIGLRPLIDLEAAIKQRSSDDLSPIQRAVPVEIGGVVLTLNRLFEQVTATLDAQSQFIANAAHQLRNPIAGVQSLAEAVKRARTPEDVSSRADDLLIAARQTSDLTQRLLLHERAKAISPQTSFTRFPISQALETWADAFASQVPSGVQFVTTIAEMDSRLKGDEVMLKEALSNLISNAVTHGGPTLTRIEFGAATVDDRLEIWVEDDGQGIPSEAVETALRRFAQVGTNPGSGLGLSITQAIVDAHDGELKMTPKDPGLRISIQLDLVPT